jgi:hypothetical protein
LIGCDFKQDRRERRVLHDVGGVHGGLRKESEQSGFDGDPFDQGVQGIRENPVGAEFGFFLLGKDPNRDWHTQTLPEIQAVTRFLRNQVTGDGRNVWVSIDYHATNRDFFYIGKEHPPTCPGLIGNCRGRTPHVIVTSSRLHHGVR